MYKGFLSHRGHVHHLEMHFVLFSNGPLPFMHAHLTRPILHSGHDQNWRPVQSNYMTISACDYWVDTLLHFPGKAATIAFIGKGATCERNNHLYKLSIYEAPRRKRVWKVIEETFQICDAHGDKDCALAQWFEGYIARMGLIFVDFNTLKIAIKESGRWMANYFGTA